MTEGKDNSEGTNVKTEWNLNKYKSNLIGGLVEKSVHYSLRGNHFANFNCWRHISILIKNRLSSEQIKQLKILQGNVSKSIFKIPKNKRNTFDDEKILFKNEFPFRVEEYIDYLNELLRKIGLDLEDSTDKGYFG